MKACKINKCKIKYVKYTNTLTHKQTRTHTQVDFSIYLVFTDYACFFLISKESIMLDNVWFHAFIKLKQYQQLQENCTLSASKVFFLVLLWALPGTRSKCTHWPSWILNNEGMMELLIIDFLFFTCKILQGD